MVDDPHCIKNLGLQMDCTVDGVPVLTDPEYLANLQIFQNKADISILPESFKQSHQDMLSSLPSELKEMIFRYLNLFEKLLLKLTNRHFYQYIADYPHADYLKAEQSKACLTLNVYFCYMCFRLRPRARFGDRSRVHGKAVSLSYHPSPYPLHDLQCFCS